MRTDFYPHLENFLKEIPGRKIDAQRKKILQRLAQHVQEALQTHNAVNLVFICTHNSRRSIFCQIWAAVMAQKLGFPQIHSYSGGTTETEVFPLVIGTLKKQGLQVEPLSRETNPIYALKYADDQPATITFSKDYTHFINPKRNFIAVMTCDQADQNCPSVIGADQRIALPYEDPKAFDQHPRQAEVYRERSLQIAAELTYVFSKISR
jgi:arsenate reductase